MSDVVFIQGNCRDSVDCGEHDVPAPFFLNTMIHKEYYECGNEDKNSRSLPRAHGVPKSDINNKEEGKGPNAEKPKCASACGYDCKKAYMDLEDFKYHLYDERWKRCEREHKTSFDDECSSDENYRDPKCIKKAHCVNAFLVVVHFAFPDRAPDFGKKPRDNGHKYADH